ncbi:MAG: hypothetical protein OER43_07780 [Gammaproteobacteria bacterium]|nr:hypothetical protein [Gammaproteobacteria bacterium]MDH3412390.1 hypothetical protein [Gammaproteobacteria bacterium]
MPTPPENLQLRVGYRPALEVRHILLFNSHMFLPGFLPVTIVVFIPLGRIDHKLAAGYWKSGEPKSKMRARSASTQCNSRQNRATAEAPKMSRIDFPIRWPMHRPGRRHFASTDSRGQ